MNKKDIMNEDINKYGLEDDPTYEEPCLNPEHTPPTHLYILPGKRYRHICPGCKKEYFIKPIGCVFSN